VVRGSSGSRKLLLHVISIVLGVSLLVVIGLHVGIGSVISDLSRLDPVVLIPLVAIYSVSWVLRGERFRRILALLGARVGYMESLGIELIGDLANQVIPAKLGDVVKVAYLKKKNLLGYASGTVAAFMVRIMDLLAVAVMALVSVVLVSGNITSDYRSYALIVALLVSFILVCSWFFIIWPGVLSRLLVGPLRRFRPSLVRIADLLRSSPGKLAGIFLVSALIWLFDVLTLFVILLAFGVSLSLPETAFVLLAASLVKIVPVTPNGLGIYEGAMVVLLGSCGVSGSEAFSIGVLDHGFVNVYSLVLGVVALYRMGIGFAGLRKMTPREDVTETGVS